ncbi:MAG: endoribonuclease MazF [Phototrophicaceae bacterium]
MVTGYIPERGDVVWLEFSPQAGHEQAGQRPALVLSPKTYNEKVGLAICCPITSKAKGYPFEVKLPDGFNITGVVLTDQVKSLDWRARHIKFIAKAPSTTVKDVLAKLNTLLT